MQFYDQRGLRRNTDDVHAVETLEKLKKDNGANPWPVIEKCLEIWKSRSPQQWKSYLVYMDDIRETRKDRKFASAHDKKNDAYLRYTIDIPEKIMYMIRCLYDPEELDMNREFFKEFGKRFPSFKVAERN